jgi:preprotein translocase subunit YajC
MAFVDLSAHLNYMNWIWIKPLLALGPSPAGTQQDPKGALFGNLGVMVLLFVMFYFALIRPQQKKQKEHAALLKNVRAGDKIVTTGGVIAIVITVKESTLSVRSADSKFEITKSAIAEITERSGESSED